MKMIWIVRLLLLSTLAALVWSLLPARLDVDLSQPQTLYRSSAGVHAIMITLTHQGNDNGTVAMEIFSAGDSIGTIDSTYNYDFFSNQPAGWMRRSWVDGDWQRDLLLTLPDGNQRYFVSSIDGQIYQQ